MIRCVVAVVSIVCCESFHVLQTPMRPPQSINTRRHVEVDELLVLAGSPESDESLKPPLVQAATPNTPGKSYSGKIDRRTLLKVVPSTLAAGMIGLGAGLEQAASARVTPKAAAAGAKVVVLGGSGFVGSRVCEILVEAGAKVSSVSKTGSKPTKWADGESWVEKVAWNKGDPTADDLSPLFSGASAVISCVGVIGGSDAELERGNGDVNVAAAEQAAKAKVGRFVYVSVSHLVPEALGGVAFQGYFIGKKRAEEAILQCFPSTGIIIKPTFIYGGDSFGLTPPRVSDGYGAGIDALLSSGLVRGVAGISPGLIKVALSPPVSRDNVALACIAGALGRLEGTSYDGSEEINVAALKA